MAKAGPFKRVSGPVGGLKYEDLVEVVRGNSRSKRENEAYNEIEKRIKVKIIYIIRQFYIPGLNFDDILQEALFALRFKAIPDYDGSRGQGPDPYPFDRFAVLCIRRHLSTILKGSFQNKKKVLNTSISLDQDRGSHDDENLYLADIIPKTDTTVMDEIGEKEYYKTLFSSLYVKLSKLEKSVFVLYTYKYSYDEITDKINRVYEKRGSRKKVNIKSVDNALSRIKMKAKEVYDQHKEEEDD
jgi:RNA polymerase sporulation-specific sigma factor